MLKSGAKNDGINHQGSLNRDTTSKTRRFPIPPTQDFYNFKNVSPTILAGHIHMQRV